MTGIPQLLTALAHMRNPSLLSPSNAARISINTGPNSFYGEKYKVEKVMTSFTGVLFLTLCTLLTILFKVFEDDGKIMSGITSAVYDSKRKKLFMNGMSFF
jgi:arylesterase / paraoxonase